MSSLIKLSSAWRRKRQNQVWTSLSRAVWASAFMSLHLAKFKFSNRIVSFTRSGIISSKRRLQTLMLSSEIGGIVLGELALLYNCRRTATVRALTTCVLWSIDRHTFRQIMISTNQSQRNMHKMFLRKVPTAWSTRLLSKTSPQRSRYWKTIRNAKSTKSLMRCRWRSSRTRTVLPGKQMGHLKLRSPNE